MISIDMNINKAFAIIEIMVVLAIIGAGGWFVHKTFSPAPVKIEDTPIGKVQKLEDEGSKKADAVQQKVTGEDRSQLTNGQAAVHATGVAIERADLKAAAGKDPSHEIKTAKEINDIAQKAIDMGLNQPVDPKLLAWFIDSIDKKNSEIERERQIGQQMLDSKSKELIASTERETKLIKEKADIETKYQIKIDAAQKIANDWSLENAAKAKKLDQIYFYIYLFAGVYIFSILAPMIGKVFPGFAPIANIAGAVMAPMVAHAKSKADALATDLVALNNKSKEFIENIDPAKVDQFKKEVSNWWGDDNHSQHAVEEIKKTLRL